MVFRFKCFEMAQDRCAMKIGTDGVLLGAWANINNAKKILDIGTGTGLLALMCAQRNIKASITAIEIDLEASKQAEENFLKSTWKDRINGMYISLQEFLNTPTKFDHIICNPPYFKVNKFINSQSRKQAREQTDFNLILLANSCQILLNENGIVSIVYPYQYLEELKTTFEKHYFYPNRICNIKGNAKKEYKRVLIEFSRQKSPCVASELIIETEKRHEYTEDYKNLTKDFYLNSTFDRRK